MKTYSEDEDLTNSPSRFESTIYLENAKDAQDGIFVVLVCGDGLAEGQSFLWANTLVNWDLHGGAENVAQRSWRLDRMLPHNPTYPPLSPSFKIIHFVVTETDNLQQLNTIYGMNRTILGEKDSFRVEQTSYPKRKGSMGQNGQITQESSVSSTFNLTRKRIGPLVLAKALSKKR